MTKPNLVNREQRRACKKQGHIWKSVPTVQSFKVITLCERCGAQGEET